MRWASISASTTTTIARLGRPGRPSWLASFFVVIEAELVGLRVPLDPCHGPAGSVGQDVLRGTGHPVAGVGEDEGLGGEAAGAKGAMEQKAVVSGWQHCNESCVIWMMGFVNEGTYVHHLRSRAGAWLP